ncbi:hypothetical protein [Erythrobacter sp.]|uniref:hypothetical protein n=1 Tax=Erythrobacter sp. TaxID=1042 RepID=UPI003C736386
MKEKIALYSLVIEIAVLGTAIYRHLDDGTAIALDRLALALLLVPAMACVIWLRWDWAPEVGRKARARKRRETSGQ